MVFETARQNVFDSCILVEVRDKDLLIAVGVFDKGKKKHCGHEVNFTILPTRNAVPVST